MKFGLEWLGKLGHYFFAALFVAAAALVRAALPDILGTTPYLAFYLAWIGAAALGGFGPGVFATLLSWLCVNILFDQTQWQIHSDHHELGRLIVLLTGGIGISFVAQIMRSSRSNERRQTQTLENERRLLQGIMNGAKNSHLVYLDRDFNFVRVNEAYAKTCGYMPEEMVGKNHFVLYPHVENEVIFRRVRDTGEPAEYHDKPFEFPDQPERGTTYWDWTLTPIKDATGVKGLVLSLFETTARKRAEDALRESERRFRSYFETSIVGVAITSPEKGWLEVNGRICAILGYSRDELLAMTWAELTHPDDLEADNVQFERLLCGEIDSYSMDKRFIQKGGEIVWTRLGVGCVRNEDGTLNYTVALLQDITDRKRAEDALRENEVDLKRLVNDLERSNRDLEQFAYVASHDLQEPLRQVMSFSQMIQEQYSAALDGEGKKLFNFVLEGGRRMQSLIRDLLEFSRAGRGPGILGKISVNLQEVLENALTNLQGRIDETKAVINQDPMPVLNVAASQIMQVFQNLIGNALKFKGDKRPEIHIGARRADGHWLFWIKDNGIGFEQKQAAKIFEVFGRLHSRQQYEGTGIGLPICKRIVELHGGRIWAESEPGNGAAFFFTLPE